MTSPSFIAGWFGVEVSQGALFEFSEPSGVIDTAITGKSAAADLSTPAAAVQTISTGANGRDVSSPSSPGKVAIGAQHVADISSPTAVAAPHLAGAVGDISAVSAASHAATTGPVIDLSAPSSQLVMVTSIGDACRDVSSPTGKVAAAETLGPCIDLSSPSAIAEVFEGIFVINASDLSTPSGLILPPHIAGSVADVSKPTVIAVPSTLTHPTDISTPTVATKVIGGAIVTDLSSPSAAAALHGVYFDSVGAGLQNTSSCTHVAAAGATIIAFALITPSPGVTVSYGGVNMTLFASTPFNIAGTFYMGAYYLLNAPGGTNTLANNVGTGIILNCMSFTNTSAIPTIATHANSATASLSQSATSTASHMVAQAFATDGGGALTGYSQTQEWENASNATNALVMGYAPGASTVAFSATSASAHSWGAMAVELVPIS